MIDSDLESDLEAELEDLRQLTAALEDEPGPSRGASQISENTTLSTFNSVQDDFINIDTAIALNKLYDEKLQGFEKMLIKRLNQCRQRLQEVQSTDGLEKNNKSNESSFRYIYCGKPYFKDMFFFPAPDNEDTLLRAKAGMYDFSSVQSVPGWTIKDKNQFTRLIHKMSKEIRTRELKSKVAHFQRKLAKKIPEEAKDTKQISKLKKEMDNVGKMSLKELALPMDKEYDWDFVANKLNNRHKPQEYRGLWKLFLHPSINKTPWCKKEHATLQKIVMEKQFQDWEAIAEELNTGRSPYQCFVYVRTNMGNTFTLHKWTKDEEEYLKRLIEYYREDNYIPWSKIAGSMENRTKIQIYNKYLRMAEQRKGRFLPEEDAVILTFAEKYGPDFKRMMWYLPGRSITQCRVRYQVLCKKKVSIPWTAQEDKKLIQLMANQDTDKNYSSITKHFPGKDRVNIRSRHMTLERWMMSHPNLDIDKAPRRGPRRLNRGNLTDNLNKAIENLKTRMKSDLQENKSKVITMHSEEQKIDDAIIDIFVKHQIKFEDAHKDSLKVHQSQIKQIDESSQNNKTTTELDKETVDAFNLKQVLILLKAKLNKEKFLRSKMAPKYPQLFATTNIYATIKKSYSKKENTSNIVQPMDEPDVWGNSTLNRLEHVLPPNYATITGCKKIINYISDGNENAHIKTLNNNIHTNRVLRDQMALLLERFNTLFLWPILMTNVPPSITQENLAMEPTCYQPPIKKFANIIYQKEDYALALPKCSQKKIINDVIDLEDTRNDDVTFKEGFDNYGYD